MRDLVDRFREDGRLQRNNSDEEEGGGQSTGFYPLELTGIPLPTLSGVVSRRSSASTE